MRPRGAFPGNELGASAVEFAAVIAPLLLLILGWRLGIAYRGYLRFPHAVATVVASQVIVALALLEGFLVWLFPR